MPESRLNSNNYQFIIIGGGAAAFAAATRASELGIRTAMINSGLPLGGTCVNVGCVPSKHLLAVSDEYFYPQRPVFDALADGHRARFDFRVAIQEKRRLINELQESNYTAVLGSLSGVDYIEGRARFRSPTEVEVNGQILTGKKFLIATGSRPSVLPFPGIEGVQYITNREAMELEELPRSLIVIGAGPVGLELGQMFLHFGTRVTVLEKIPQVLPRIEPEVANELQRSLESEGMEIYCACDIQRVWQEGDTRFVQADVMGERRIFHANQLLLATGVVPNSDSMGLDAAGDAVGKMFLETVAAREGYIAAANAFEDARKRINYDTVPSAVFTNPQVATVGLTEEEEMRRFRACACRTVEVARIPKAKAIKETRGLIKMVIHPENSKVVGVHMVAPNAADLIHEAVLAVKFGLTIDERSDHFTSSL